MLNLGLKLRIKEILWDYLISSSRDGNALQQIGSLVAGGLYIPWSESALSATAVATILNDITVNRRSTIVECGGGVSTLFIGSLLKERDTSGGHLYTIEHNDSWIEVLQDMVKDHGID